MEPSLLLWTFCAIERAGLGPALYACGIQSATKDVVAYTGKVFHTTAADQHDAVFLEVVTFARDVGIDLFRVGETYAGNLSHCGVRFLRGRRVDPEAYATLLRTSIQSAGLALSGNGLASFAD